MSLLLKHLESGGAGVDFLSSIQLDSHPEEPSEMGEEDDDSSHTNDPHSQALQSIRQQIQQLQQEHAAAYQDDEEEGNYNEEEEPSVLLDPMELAAKETTRVTRWKTFVMSLLLANAGLVTISAFEFLRREEEAQFTAAFGTAASTVSDAGWRRARVVQHTLQQFGETITSYALDTHVEWPLISLPHWERRAAPFRQEAFLDQLAIVPLVEPTQRSAWEDYSIAQQSWIPESYVIAQLPYPHTNTSIPTAIHNWGEVAPQNRTLYAPLWQTSPPPPPDAVQAINSDLLSTSSSLLPNRLEQQFLQSPPLITVSEAFVFGKQSWASFSQESLLVDPNATLANNNNTNSTPQSLILSPIYNDFDNQTRTTTAIALGVLSWQRYLSNLLPEQVHGILAVLQNPCTEPTQHLSFVLEGPNATFLAAQDLHDSRFDPLLVPTNLTQFPITDHCSWTLSLFPTQEFRLQYSSSRPEYFALGLVALFLVTGIVFAIYVAVSRHRQRQLMALAVSTSAIVASLYPQGVRERLLKDAQKDAWRQMEAAKQERPALTTGHSFSHLMMMQATAPPSSPPNERPAVDPPTAHTTNPPHHTRSRPIADVFPAVTVLFGDIVNFTAWSSVREPPQVFELLETLYHAFDAIAKRRQVYKIETIGDCYVACAGLPIQCNDHAVVMARFARECLSTLDVLTKQLERTMGPETGELKMRVGLHSGPVTAGVLRGDKARYQLFGDTVHIAAQMESTSEANRVQISQETAELLALANKSGWFIPREQKVHAKGKGELQTYWLHPKEDEVKNEEMSDSGSVTHHWLDLPGILTSPGTGNDELRARLSEQDQRLADWNANQLLKLLNQVAKQRNVRLAGHPNSDLEEDIHVLVENDHVRWTDDSATVIDEVKDSINMPRFDPAYFPIGMDNNMSELSDVVIQQLHDYVSIICSMYNSDNFFHNYQHASHVTMNVVKLLSRIVTPPRSNNPEEGATGDVSKQSELYDKSLGLAVDPLAQFALAFAALIQDVDHPGVSNSQLVREGSRLARRYEYVSIIEQNSFTVAWDLLMDPMFSDLRTTIYTNREEFDHFRQVLVNAVMATDMCNEASNAARNQRWRKAFYADTSKVEFEDRTPETSSSSYSTNSGDSKLKFDRKATLVIECIMQASDISNLMQHWHIFQKWNEKEFRERCLAYQQGRESRDPAKTWYLGQLNIFDNIGIPLAKKLKESGVFGSYSDDYLIHAKKNRAEWLKKGTSIVQKMQRNFAEKNNDKASRSPSRRTSSEPHRPEFVGMRRTRSLECIVPRFFDDPHFSDGWIGRRRLSFDGAPRASRRSTNDALVDPSIAIAQMFSQLPDFRRSPSNRAPQHPGRTEDSVPHGLVEDPSSVVQDMFDGSERKKKSSKHDAPRTLRSTRENFETTEIAREASMAEDQQPDQHTMAQKTRPKRWVSKELVEMPSAIDDLLGSPNATTPTTHEAKRPSPTSSLSADPTLATALDVSLNSCEQLHQQ